jgi:hypothetical protein
LRDTGAVEVTLVGKPPQNEEGALDAARLLVDHLNAQGANWCAPVKPEHEYGVDALAADRGYAKKTLEMQVARALAEQAWRALGRTGNHEIPTDVAELANDLLSAAHKKAGKYPVPEDRAAMTLILDVSRTVGHTFRQVIDRFRREHAAACRALGFRDVWLVGHRPEFVERLDLDP